ncbi:hypothetical protein RFI_06791 [Reticulomyxa filosa]|uniref:Uncharacterized protein n=1 Tax=Reticulomyxa filosa TaxID=46433 RepID=X6NWH2_RETFI|nr:hypothetical protein RFI_06791 [Reticulomyxa filosa]|eukprot:ETO30326.1 hypothetical protein RFI_06791 [Reticulomyxa filosa]
MQLIEENNILKEYYDTIISILNNVFSNAHMIQNDNIDQQLPIIMKDDMLGVSLPGTSYNKTQKPNINALATFFANSMEQYSSIETLARCLTITQKHALISLPTRLLDRMELLHKITLNNIVVGSDCNTVIRRKAKFDCDKFISAIENGIIQLDSKRSIEPLMKIILNEM